MSAKLAALQHVYNIVSSVHGTFHFLLIHMCKAFELKNFSKEGC